MRIFRCLWLFLALSSLPSCDRKEESHAPLIGFSLDSFVVERWQRDRDIFFSKIKEMGADVIFQNANEDHELQVRQIQFLESKNVDVLVVVPNDGFRLSPIIREVKARGIKVISYDRLVRSADVDLYISFDNVEVGRLMAQALVKAKPKGSFLVLNGAESDYNSYMLHQGFHEVLDPLMKARRIKIVEESWLKNWSSNEASLFFVKALGEFPHIDGVISANDMVAETAVQAFSERRRLRDVAIVGMDAELSACQRVVEGTQLMTVYKPIEQLATRAAEAAYSLARGRPPRSDETINDGQYSIPFLKLAPIAVTAENMDRTVIRDGFHHKDDVYRNVTPPKTRP